MRLGARHKNRFFSFAHHPTGPPITQTTQVFAFYLALLSFVFLPSPPFSSPLLPQTSRPLITIITAVIFITQLPFARDLQLQLLTMITLHNYDNLSLLAVPAIIAETLYHVCFPYALSARRTDIRLRKTKRPAQAYLMRGMRWCDRPQFLRNFFWPHFPPKHPWET